MFKTAIPVLHVRSSEAAEAFYCEKLGFRQQFAYRVDESKADPCYMGLVRDGAWLHLSSFSGDGVSGGIVRFEVDNVDELHAELVEKGLRVDAGPVDQTWGTREMYIKDADGNSVRFIR
jgi:catechol 2,3-dioxygenase-like lactoylglutathione lyase family enzyme